MPGRGTVGRQLKPDEVEKVRGELAAYEEFAALAGQIAEVSEAICEARPVRSGAARPLNGGAKRGLCDQLAARLAAEAAAEVERLVAAAALSLAGGAGTEQAELAIRSAVTELGRGLLEPLLAADAGYRGPRAQCVKPGTRRCSPATGTRP